MKFYAQKCLWELPTSENCFYLAKQQHYAESSSWAFALHKYQFFIQMLLAFLWSWAHLLAIPIPKCAKKWKGNCEENAEETT